MKRHIVRSLLTLIAAIVVIYAGFVWHNNRAVPDIADSEYAESLEKSIRWMTMHSTQVLDHNNAMLWWMIKKSVEATGDQRLRQLLADYKLRHMGPKSGNIWQGLFDEDWQPPLRLPNLSLLPDYNVFFIYGLTCNNQLRSEELIQRQLEEDFCYRYHPITPPCATHQLMGVQFAKKNKCIHPDKIESLIGRLQDRIETELFWDPRVVDVYLQRALMLAESGARARLKAVWVRNILSAQNDDGGWGDFQPLIAVGDSRHLGFTAMGFGVQSQQSGFHATAQGILLLSLLSKNEDGNPSRETFSLNTPRQ